MRSATHLTESKVAIQELILIQTLNETRYTRLSFPSIVLPARQAFSITMTTHFITAEIDLTASPQDLPKQIEAELEKRGEPLRWAVTEVDETTGKAKVEAVVTQPTQA